MRKSLIVMLVLGACRAAEMPLESGSYRFDAPENVTNTCGRDLFPLGREPVVVDAKAASVTLDGSVMKREGKTFRLEAKSAEQIAVGCTVNEEQTVAGELVSSTEISLKVERRFRAQSGQCIGVKLTLPCEYAATAVGTLQR